MYKLTLPPASKLSFTTESLAVVIQTQQTHLTDLLLLVAAPRFVFSTGNFCLTHMRTHTQIKTAFWKSSFEFLYLSANALISHSSNSSSATQVSITTGPVCLGVSGLFGLSALDRSPFLWGVGVSSENSQNTHIKLNHKTKFKCKPRFSLSGSFYKQKGLSASDEAGHFDKCAICFK